MSGATGSEARGDTAATPERFTVYTGEDEKPVIVETPFFRVAVYSRRSPAKETPNEDAAGIVDVGGASVLLVVADGVGGARAGDQAARLVIEHLVERTPEAETDAVLRERILTGFDEANAAILELGVGAAATATCISVHDGVLRSYQVGDSIGLVVGQRGKIKHQTVSHSPVGYMVESGLIAEEQALDHRDRHLVSNMVGSTDMSIEIGSTITLSARDTILLASDGLSDNLRQGEVAEIIRKGRLSVAAQSLADLARERMAGAQRGEPSKPDDLTFILCRRR